MFWASIFYMKAIYALLSFPFLLFVLPMVGPALHHAKETAYDQAGRLVPKLSDSLIKEKIKQEEEPPDGERKAKRGLLGGVKRRLGGGEKQPPTKTTAQGGERPYVALEV